MLVFKYVKKSRCEYEVESGAVGGFGYGVAAMC